MKKQVKLLLTGMLMVTSFGVLSVSNFKTMIGDFNYSTNEVEGEKIAIKKKVTTVTDDPIKVGTSTKVSGAVVQRKTDADGKITMRFVSAVSISNGVVDGEYGFHVEITRSDNKKLNAYVPVECIYTSMLANKVNYSAKSEVASGEKGMLDFLKDTGLQPDATKTDYNYYMTYSVSGIPSTEANTSFKVVPYFQATDSTTKELATSMKEVNSTGVMANIGGKAINMVSTPKGSGDNWDAQYKATITAAAGEVVTFYVDGEKVTSKIDLGMGDNSSNNVLDKKDGNFEVRTAIENEDVYLKQYGEYYNVWMKGYVEPDPIVTGATVKIGSAAEVEMKEIATDPKYPTMTKQYAVEGVKVAAGDKLIFTVDGKEVTPGASGDGNNAKTSENGLAIVTAGEKVNIYLKVFKDGGYDVWVTAETTIPDTPISEVTTLYLKVNENWTQSNARFAAYFYLNDSVNVWADLEKVAGETNVYKVEIPSKVKEDKMTHVIFCRMDGGTTENNWNNKWNQTGDLDIPTDANLSQYVVTEGTWDKGGGNWVAAPSK